ncbi:MAG: hypothetical protein JO288_17285 [Hyphomicrobiales bacterium]|nr:hypothetical protein [Hyphomicrobiales bacterium]
MAIRVVPGSAQMPVTKRPVLTIGKDDDNKNMVFRCVELMGEKPVLIEVERPIEMRGRCKITGDPSDNPAGWTLGLIQLQWIETNWGYYQGQKDTDGSVFLQRGRPPARPAQGCRDTFAVGGVLFDNKPGQDRTVAKAGAPFPVEMTALFSDSPFDFYPLIRPNTRTGKTNFLREVQLEFHFCTILALMDPNPALQVLALVDLEKAFRYLKHVFWNVHWQAKFLPTNFANVAAPWTITRTGGALGNSVNVSPTFDGRPTDARFAGIGSALLAPNCGKAMAAARAAPNTRENLRWE